MARLETLQVDLELRSKGLCLAIMGVGAGAELGLEKLGIFVKSVAPGGVAAQDGRVMEGDQVIEVNRQSLAGVTKTHALEGEQIVRILNQYTKILSFT